MKRILINATQEEELRVAIVDGQKLINLDIETPSAGRKKGNIYQGVITRAEPGLDAAFIDYGDAKHGFLPFREISQAYFKNKTSGGRGNSTAIAKSLPEGQALMVQVQREGHGGKGAALTTYISLAGRYLVLMPNNPRAGGVSRRMEDKERDATRQILSQLDIRDEEGVIVRTEGAGRDIKLLQRDLDYLRKLWDSVVTAAKGQDQSAPFLVYEEGNIVICALRDHFSDDTEEIIIDNEKVYADARDFIKLVMPQHLGKLKLHKEPVPLFNRYHIESRIETAFDREIILPSGGSVVFDRTEAMLSIDINSGKATRGSNIEETALNTNLEAADEIALQLRLRDLGGLIVIDFIDMFSLANRKAVENRLHQAMRQDQARVQFERISRFGLLEMSRQRLRPSLSESSHMTCPRCNGKGSIRTLESSALATLRMMEEEAIKEKGGRVVAQLPVEITSFLLNEKRDKINEIESRHSVELTIVPDAHMQIPHFQIRRYRADDKENRNKYSYQMMTERKPALPHSHSKAGDGERERPAVGAAVGFLDKKKTPGTRKTSRFLALFASLLHKEPSPKEAVDESERSKSAGSRDNGTRRRRRGGRRRGRSQDRRPAEAASSRQSGTRPQAPREERGQAPREERGQAPREERGRPADARAAGGGSQRQGSGRQSRRRSTTRRRTPAVPALPTATPVDELDSNRFSRPPRDDRATDAPVNVARHPDTPTGSTVFDPPMPILPKETPVEESTRGEDIGGESSAAAVPPMPSLPSTPPAPPASATPAAPAAPTPATPQAVEPKPDDIGTTPPASEKEQVKPPAASPPRFDKPSNLTQVETKNAPSGQD